MIGLDAALPYRVDVQPVVNGDAEIDHQALSDLGRKGCILPVLVSRTVEAPRCECGGRVGLHEPAASVWGAGWPQTSSAQRRCRRAHRIATEPSLSADTDRACLMPCWRIARSVSRWVRVDRSAPPGHGRNELCAVTASTNAVGHPSGESTPTTSTIRARQPVRRRSVRWATRWPASSTRPIGRMRTAPVARSCAARSMPRTWHVAMIASRNTRTERATEQRRATAASRRVVTGGGPLCRRR